LGCLKPRCPSGLRRVGSGSVLFEHFFGALARPSLCYRSNTHNYLFWHDSMRLIGVGLRAARAPICPDRLVSSRLRVDILHLVIDRDIGGRRSRKMTL
jgi:hypothetical protein